MRMRKDGKVIGGILAGGSGTRMKSELPKQFMEIGKKAIIIHTVEAFFSCTEIDKIVIAMNSQWMEYCEQLFIQNEIDMSRIVLIEGGKDRFESMVNISRKSVEIYGENTILVIHDCARPFVSQRIIQDNIRLIDEYDMVTTSVPAIDTVLISKDQKTSFSMPDRAEVFQDQGPQTFLANDFLQLIHRIPENEKAIYMEAGRLYLACDKSVGIAQGDRMNFKITTDFDLQFAEFLLQN